MAVVAHYMRYHAPEQHECDSVDEAFRWLAWQEDAGNISSVSVVDGDTVYERDDPEFERRFDAAWDALC